MFPNLHFPVNDRRGVLLVGVGVRGWRGGGVGCKGALLDVHA